MSKVQNLDRIRDGSRRIEEAVGLIVSAGEAFSERKKGSYESGTVKSVNEENLSRVKAHIMQAWNGKKQARWYARDVNDSYSFYDIDLDSQVRLVCSLVTKGSRLADIGCGTGALSLKLASLGYDVTGFDSSLPMLKQLRKRSQGLSIRLEQADVFHLDDSFGLYDAAVSRWVLTHFPNWGEIVASVGRMLRPGGILVFDMKSREHQDFVSSHETPGERAASNEPNEIPEDFDPLRVVTTASAPEIDAVLADAGFELLGVYPSGLFARNGLLSIDLNPQEIEKRDKAVNSLLRKSEPLRSLIQSLEVNVTPHIPQHLLFRTLVVARRK